MAPGGCLSARQKTWLPVNSLDQRRGRAPRPAFSQQDGRQFAREAYYLSLLRTTAKIALAPRSLLGQLLKPADPPGSEEESWMGGRWHWRNGGRRQLADQRRQVGCGSWWWGGYESLRGRAGRCFRPGHKREVQPFWKGGGSLENKALSLLSALGLEQLRRILRGKSRQRRGSALLTPSTLQGECTPPEPTLGAEYRCLPQRSTTVGANRQRVLLRGLAGRCGRMRRIRGFAHAVSPSRRPNSAAKASYWRIGQDTACLNRFRYHDGSYDLLLLNDTCHLTGLM